MAMLKDKLDAFEGQPEQGWNKRKSISVGERGQVYRAIFFAKILVCCVCYRRWYY